MRWEGITLFCMASFIRTAKSYAKDRTISDEEFVRSLFQPLIQAGNVKGRNHEPLDLNKSQTSGLLNNKADVPKAMRKTLSLYGLRERMLPAMNDFLEDYIRTDKLDSLLDSLKRLYRSDASQSFAIEETISKKQGAPALFTLLFLKAVEVNNKIEANTGTVLWQNGVDSLNYTQGDLFSYGFDNRKRARSIVVIPVETTFETKISWMKEAELYPLVSANTIHGQWLHRWEQSGNDMQLLADQIRGRLKAYRIAGDFDTDGQYKVPIGTVVEIDSKNARYFLLPIAEFDSENRAHSNCGQIQKAINNLMVYYDRCGQGDLLAIPLLGTGMSRAGLSYQASFNLIQSTILAHKHLVQGKVLIIATPEAYDQIQIGGEAE